MVCPITWGDHKEETTGQNIMSASATQGGHKKVVRVPYFIRSLGVTGRCSGSIAGRF